MVTLFNSISCCTFRKLAVSINELPIIRERVPRVSNSLYKVPLTRDEPGRQYFPRFLQFSFFEPRHGRSDTRNLLGSEKMLHRWRNSSFLTLKPDVKKFRKNMFTQSRAFRRFFTIFKNRNGISFAKLETPVWNRRFFSIYSLFTNFFEGNFKFPIGCFIKITARERHS